MHSELGLDQSYKADITRAVKVVTSKQVAEARKKGHLLVLAKVSRSRAAKAVGRRNEGINDPELAD